MTFEIVRECALEMVAQQVPYVWGGSSVVKGVDCSGLVQILLEKGRIDPPGDQTAQALYDHFVALARGVDQAPMRGALCFYGKGRENISHVAMLLTRSVLVEAGGGGRECVTAEISKQKGACVRLRPLGHRRDLVAVVPVKYPE